MDQQVGLSRRNLLKGLGIGSLGLGASLGLVPRAARAQDTDSVPSEVSAFSRFSVGDLQITAVQDAAAFVPPMFVAANASDEAADLLIANNLSGEATPLSINPLLVNAGDRLVLLDAGYGPGEAPAPNGLLLPTLRLLGVDPGDVTDVLISHFHFDHVGGIASAGQPVFPNATVHFPRPELEFLEAGPTGIELIDEQMQLALGQLQPIMDADQLELYDDEAEPVPDIQAIDTPGHTPGHFSFLIQSNGDRLLCPVDVAVHWIISLARPDLHMLADTIPDVAVETRQSLFARAADEQLKVSAYHFPFNSLGFVDREGDGFRFIQTGA